MSTQRVARPRSDPSAAGRSWQVLTASRLRVAGMLLAGIATAVVVGFWSRWLYAPLAGWEAAAIVFIVWSWCVIGRFDAARTHAHASREDPGRVVTDLFVLFAAVASLAAVGVIVGKANSSTGLTQDVLAAFGVLGVVLSWAAVHTLFTLRYARLYFTGAQGGIDFNQQAPPRYLDFAYLAFTIGMTFQVSDTDIRNSAIRAAALRHAILSFLLGAVILAGTINLIAGLGGKGGG